MKVLIVVTHLLGTGHLARALTLARAFTAQGHRAVVASGGMPAPHLETPSDMLEQLPPVRSDGIDFSRLLDAGNAPVTPEYMAHRREALISILHRMEPDVLITELFPFGRRILKDEFAALLQAAQTLPSRPMIASSIRDILAPPSKPSKVALADGFVERFYDLVLCHSNAELTPLTLSWPVSQTLQPKLRYTGFVAPTPAGPHPDKRGQGSVLVSAGGGDVGGDIFACAMAAAAQDTRHWHLLLGGADAAQRATQMQADAPANVTVEPARPDFRQMLYHADASVSMCGYNTALDVLQSGVPAVFVPFDAGSEVEQGLRAEALAQQSGITLLRSAALTPQNLLHAVDAVTANPRRAPLTAHMDGANRTVEIIATLREDSDAH